MKTISQISVVIDKALSRELLDFLADRGLNKVFLETGRTSILKGRNGLASLRGKSPLAYDPVEIISMYVQPEIETNLMSQICRQMDLKTPGRGSIHSTRLSFLNSHPEYEIHGQIKLDSQPDEYFFNELTGICCVVQRGEGDPVARISLNAGSSVPVTTHGLGSGVRDKLGLLRITIPPEKELINLTLSKYDVHSVMEMFITEARLDQPGRGIAYIYPVQQGVVNTKITRSKSEQAATMEQMISAIDSIKGGMEWRKSLQDLHSRHYREFLTGIVELDLVCAEGNGNPLSCVAMENSAPGATICKTKYISCSGEEDQSPPIREICKMIVPVNAVETIAHALEKKGCFDDKTKGFLSFQMVEKAFTYRGKK